MRRALRPRHLVLSRVLGALFVSMVVYALSGGRRDADATRKGSQFLLGVGDFLVHWFMWVIAPAERLVPAASASRPTSSTSPGSPSAWPAAF